MCIRDRGKVEFGTTDREDIESAETGKKVQKLSSIKVRDVYKRQQLKIP